MLKKLLTYFLLFAFAVIFIPRSVWHSHVDEQKTCKHDDDHDHSDADEDCYVCDFTLQPALTPVSFQFNFPYSNNYIAPATAISLAAPAELTVQYLRGPPITVIV